MLDRIRSSRDIHIVGVSGTEGAASAIFLQKLGVNFVAHDFSEESKFQRNFQANHFAYSASTREDMLKKLRGIQQLKFQNNYLEDVEKADLIFVSQNFEAYIQNEKLKEIFAKNPERFVTITQLYFELFPGKIIAITGTNGKSTTAKLVAEIMSASRQRVDKKVVYSTGSGQKFLSTRQVKLSSGQFDLSTQQGEFLSRQRVDKLDGKIWFTGNDRRNIQILDDFEKWQKTDWLVIEVSNRQLKFPLARAPEIGVITNVSPNHLTEYCGSFSAYESGKFSLIDRQKKGDVAVLNYDNPSTRAFAAKVKSTLLSYSTKVKLTSGVSLDGDWIVHSSKCVQSTKKLSRGQVADKNFCPVDRSKYPVDTRICPLDKIKTIGEHNLSNILAAVAATISAGVSAEIICETIAKFRGIPQRLEVVFEKNGVSFVNDSASTTPESTIAALKSFRENGVNLIAGGESKGMKYHELAREIGRQKARVILLASPLAELLGNELRNLKIDFAVVENLRDAVKIASSNARKDDIVLLSPAAAWFCYFAGKIPLGGRGFEQFAKTFA
jgi:UDP-N-acetylmuramoylalanine-D-glutamate ligase